METKEKLLTTRGIARHFGLPVEWVIAEAKAGRLPHLRAGRQRLFNVDAVLQALLEAATRLPEEDCRP